jgi:PPOX class probable F420-dependent enzyme
MIDMTNLSPFAALEGRRHCLLTTYRPTGDPVGTPVWFALDGDRLVLSTEDPSGKVKRLRNDPRVLVAPCTLRGRPLGPAVPGIARLLDAHEAEEAEVRLRRAYGIGRKLFYRTIHPMFVLRGRGVLYVEITTPPTEP